jgi:hypothetical protein
MSKSTSVISSLVAVTGLFSLPAMAGTTTETAAPAKNPPPVTPEKETPFVTGFLAAAYETHFISYGQDVWAIGNDWGEWLIHPSLELNFNLGDGWAAYVNTWWDINDLAPSPIGGNIQEIDVNAGVYYTMDKWKFQLGYGAWIYAEQVEHIIDARVTYNDGLINPFLMLHGRVDSGIAFDNGLVTQVGIAPATTLGPVSLSFPVTLSFDTDDFHGGQGGFAYVSAGLGATIPIVDHLALTLGVTYYHTNNDVIPGNPDSDFVTGSAGLVVNF